MWGKVYCLRKQHDGRDWAWNNRPSDLKSNVLTTTPLCWWEGVKQNKKKQKKQKKNKYKTNKQTD